MKRYVSLDIMRGLTVALMILVNNPGSWGKIYPPLEHAPWTGATLTDMVFPFFLFCSGVSMAFSLGKFNTFREACPKIFRRGCLIFLTGLLLNMFPFYPTSPDPDLTFGQNYITWLGKVRIFGVLQRIGLCYMLGASIAMLLKKSGKIIGAIAVLGILYTLILLIFGTEPGAFTLDGTISRKIDVWLVGESHVYHGYSFADGTRAAFDPEGILGVMTGTCTLLLGFLTGGLVKSVKNQYELSARIMVNGTLCLAGAMILSIFIPISKPLWSCSYVLLAGGWAMIVLGVLIYIIDIKKVEKPFYPFKAMGMNPLALFVGAGVASRLLGSVFKVNYGGIFATSELTSLAHALMYVAFFMILGIFLYRKKIFIKL